MSGVFLTPHHCHFSSNEQNMQTHTKELLSVSQVKLNLYKFGGILIFLTNRTVMQSN